MARNEALKTSTYWALWGMNLLNLLQFKFMCRNEQYKDVYRWTIEFSQHTHIFKVDCCLKVHNAHLKLVSSVSDKPQEFFYCSTRFNIYTLDRLAVFPIIGVTSFLFTACFRVLISLRQLSIWNVLNFDAIKYYCGIPTTHHMELSLNYSTNCRA